MTVGFERRVARRGDYVFASGCRASSPNADIEQQVDEACTDLAGALGAEGGSIADAARVWVMTRSREVGSAVQRRLASLAGVGRGPAVSVLVADLPGHELIGLTAVAGRAGGDRRSVGFGSWWEPDSPAASIRRRLVTTGTMRPIDLSSGTIPPTPEGQVAALFENLGRALDAAGVDAESVAHLFVWYSDHAFREIVNGPFADMFPIPGDRPVRHSVVRSLPDGEGVQLEAFAVSGGRRVNYTVPGTWHLGINNEINSLPYGCGVGDLLFSGGCYGGEVHTPTALPLEEQTELAVANVRSLLAAAGMDMTDVGHLFVWIHDHDRGAPVLRTLARELEAARAQPACTVLPTALPAKFGVQLELIAVRPQADRPT